MSGSSNGRMHGLGLVLGSGLVLAGTAAADPLITPDSDPTTGSVISANQFNAIEFSLAADYINVDIDASLTAAAGGSGTAYLTTAIGAGTTGADLVAQTAFDFAIAPGIDVGWVDLFSGLSLSADTYYLVFGAPFDPGTTSGSIEIGGGYDLDPNAMVGDMLFSSTIDAGFAPASEWSTSGLGNRFFRVSGDIPAPGTAALLGIAGLAATRRRR